MNKADVLTTVVTMIAGGLLTEVGVRWRRRMQNREELNSAIADLLELHFELFAYAQMTRLVESGLQIPAEVVPHLRHAIFNMLPKDPQRPARYAAAVSAIARYDPVIAYQLRSRDVVHTYQQMVLGFQTTPGAPTGLLADFDLKIAAQGANVLRRLLPKLARKSGWILSVRVWLALRRCNGDLPPEVEEMMRGEFEKLKTLTAQQPAVDQTASAVPPSQPAAHS